jgi:hypothetical protein
VSVHCDAADNPAELMTFEARLPTFLQRLISILMRLLLLAVGLLFAAFLLAAGLVLTLFVVAWSLLRGHRPRIVRWRVDPRSPFAGMRRGPPKAQGEVVDIEAREVPDTAQQLTRDER